jgi:hypothetical protein
MNEEVEMHDLEENQNHAPKDDSESESGERSSSHDEEDLPGRFP